MTAGPPDVGRSGKAISISEAADEVNSQNLLLKNPQKSFGKSAKYLYKMCLFEIDKHFFQHSICNLSNKHILLPLLY